MTLNWLGELSSSRSRHVVFLVHVWLCTPFLVFWFFDPRTRETMGEESIQRLQPVIGLTLIYLLVRTWLAAKDSYRVRWEYLYPPIDVVWITIILTLSNRGPMSNLTLLYFLPMVEAVGSLKVRWAATVGVMVVAGMIVSTTFVGVPPPPPAMTAREMLQNETLNVAFRLFFLVLIASLMGYQAAIAAEFRAKLGVAADRNRIAREMHDGVQGSLISLSSQLELIGHMASKDPDRTSQLAREARETARQSADELRFLVQRLRAPALSEGFVPALRQYAHNVCERKGIELEFLVDGQETRIHPEREQALFRIAQEGLTNVIKHASAKRVEICVEFCGEEVKLTVQDDGVGFDISRTKPKVGLASMRERAAKLGGDVSLTPREGGGTLLTARF